MKFQPFVSILIPIRNVAQYLPSCLDALLNQTYSKDKFEILVLDNKSTDGSIGIVEEYEKKTKGKVRIFQMGVDSPPKKYNKIIRKTRGSILGFVDADAIVDKYWLERVIKPLKNPKVAGAGGVILTRNKNLLVPRIIGYELQDRYERMPRKIKRIATMHCVYKKDVLNKIGRFNEKLKTVYDCEIGYRINDAGYDIIFVPNAKVYHSHRKTWWSFFKQQFEYGAFAIPRYLQKPKIAKGDTVTPLFMIIQPLLIVLSLIFFILSFFGLNIKLALIPLYFLLAFFLYDTLRLTIKFKDLSAIFLIILYVIRPVAWLLGGSMMTLYLIKKKLSLKK